MDSIWQSYGTAILQRDGWILLASCIVTDISAQENLGKYAQ